MIQITSSVGFKEGKRGVDVDSHIEGVAEDIVNEAFALISSLMGQIKNANPLAHDLLLSVMAENDKWTAIDRDGKEGLN